MILLLSVVDIQDIWIAFVNKERQHTDASLKGDKRQLILEPNMSAHSWATQTYVAPNTMFQGDPFPEYFMGHGQVTVKQGNLWCKPQSLMMRLAFGLREAGGLLVTMVSA